jgi:murein DD-endopeptidase MepM/ murein hydrolase activator NlpD
MTKRIFLLFVLLSFLIVPFQPAHAQTNGPIYIVQPGDTLSSIASDFNVSVDDLITANNITDPNLLAAGQQLVIPGLNDVSGVVDKMRINIGDSYRNLMRRTQISEGLFRKLNRIISPNELYVGAPIIIPQQEATSQLTGVSQGAGESLLELAVKQNTDVWTFAHYNSLQGSWDSLSGDTLFVPGENGEQRTSGLPSAFISAEIRDLPIKQGGTGAIKVKTIPNVTLGGILVDHPLHFFPMSDGTQVALQGVHALLTPGVYSLRIDATFPDGSKQSYEQYILIVSGNYLTGENLVVDPSLIDPAITDPEQKQLEGITTPSTPTKYWDGQFTSPAIAYADSTYYTSRYGTRRTYLGQGTDLKIDWWHTGLDFGGGTGLPITAPARGKVVVSENWTVRGGTTIIDHGWGVYSGFWHQSKFDVQVGDIVEQGQVIGEVGGTGRVTGPHLHWEVWVSGIQVDPLDWLINTYP